MCEPADCRRSRGLSCVAIDPASGVPAWRATAAMMREGTEHILGWELILPVPVACVHEVCIPHLLCILSTNVNSGRNQDPLTLGSCT